MIFWRPKSVQPFLTQAEEQLNEAFIMITLLEELSMFHVSQNWKQSQQKHGSHWQNRHTGMPWSCLFGRKIMQHFKLMWMVPSTKRHWLFTNYFGNRYRPELDSSNHDSWFDCFQDNVPCAAIALIIELTNKQLKNHGRKMIDYDKLFMFNTPLAEWYPTLPMA